MSEMGLDEMTLAQEMRGQADILESGGATAYSCGIAGLLRRWADELDSEYVELPRDAEGRPWRFGDRCVDGQGECLVIKSLALGDGAWVAASTYTPGGVHVGWKDVETLRRPSGCAAMILDWVRRARSDEHMDLGELESIAGRIEAGEEW